MLAEPLLSLDAVMLSSLLQEHRDGRDPLVGYDAAARILPALGRPLTPQQTRDLGVSTWTLAGRNVAVLSLFIAAADEFIRHRAGRPNLKVRGIAKARAAKASTRGEAA